MKKLILVIVVFILIAIIFYSCDNQSTTGLRVKYFYNPGCPHCRNFMPAWQTFSSRIKGNADVQSINCAENPALCKGVTGVPHVVFSDDHNNVVYSGKRTPDDLQNFFDFFNQNSRRMKEGIKKR